MNDKSQGSRLLVWSNRFILFLILMLLMAISQFPEMHGFWADMDVCDGGVCGLIANSITHPLIRYLAYAAIIAAIAKEWVIAALWQRLKINGWSLLVTASLFLTMMVLFNLPLLQMEPV